MRMISKLFSVKFNKIDIAYLALFYKLPLLSTKVKCKIKSRLFMGPWLFSAGYVTNLPSENKNDEQVIKKINNFDDSIKTVCINSLNVISYLLMRLETDISNAALQYRNSINELISFLEKYETLQDYPTLFEENENAIIAARAKVMDHKNEFLKLITLTTSIEKLASAAIELSFLIANDTFSLSLSETLISIKQVANTELENVKTVEKKYLEVEQNLIRG